MGLLKHAPRITIIPRTAPKPPQAPAQLRIPPKEVWQTVAPVAIRSALTAGAVAAGAVALARLAKNVVEGRQGQGQGQGQVQGFTKSICENAIVGAESWGTGVRDVGAVLKKHFGELANDNSLLYY